MSGQDRQGVGWELTHIEVDLTLRPDQRQIQGTGIAHLRLDASSSYGPTLLLDEGRQRFLSIDPPEGASVTLEDSNSRAHIRFPEPLRQGATLQVPFQYQIHSGHPSDEYPNNLLIHPQATFATFGYLWHPSAPRERGPFDKQASSSLRLRMPPGWRSHSQGERIEQVDTDSMTIETWVSEDPVNRGWVAGPLRSTHFEASGVPVRLLLRDGDPAALRELARGVAAILDVLERRFGPVGIHQRADVAFDLQDGITIAEVPPVVDFGGKNDAGTLLIRPELIRSPTMPFGVQPWLLGHELAHLWWGGTVRGSNPGLRMIHEGLPQYGAMLVVEELLGRDAYLEYLRFGRPLPDGMPRFSARGYFEMQREGHDEPLMAEGAETDNQSQDPAQNKGLWILHMLRIRIGDDRFFGTLQSIQESYAGRAISLAELRQAFLQAAPEADLETFFREWLDREGAPVIEMHWSPTETLDGPAAMVVLRQRGDLYRLPLEIAVESPQGARLHRIELKSRDIRLTLSSPGHPTAVVLDPNDQHLLWRPEYGPAPQ